MSSRPCSSQRPARVRRGQPLALAGVLGRPARQPLEHDAGEHHPRAAHRRRRRVRPAERSLAAVVVRSSMIAIDDDRQAGHRRGADVLDLQRRRRPACRGPGPFTSAAMVAIDSAAIMHWLMPTTIVRSAIGSCTWRSIWPRVRPIDRAASTVVGDTVLMPCSVIRTSGGRA